MGKIGGSQTQKLGVNTTDQCNLLLTLLNRNGQPTGGRAPKSVGTPWLARQKNPLPGSERVTLTLALPSNRAQRV
ncbi:hypothetical protein NDU88_003577 [Pleurodeles waltl]|uniref:Uncharacterized protein n=1 Tax=Pleurodeles waltl TaxID=8319 RepID=A0AAV7SGC0_PLEWA|nr:hypothetical protein NDU88_003577 [Pleurodeles waltl]